MTENGVLFDTQAELAKALGVSARTVQMWRAQGMPGERGAWSLTDVREWIEENLENSPSHSSASFGEEDMGGDQLERYRGYKADLAELDLEERRKRLISRDETEAIYTDRTIALRSAFLGMGNRMAGLLEGKSRIEIAELIDDFMMEQLADWSGDGLPGVPEEYFERARAFIRGEDGIDDSQ